MRGDALDVHVVTDGKAAADSGVAHAKRLVGFAEAAVGSDDRALAHARRALLDDLGPAALVDAAAVVGTFERMVRIADATGIALDAPLELLTEDIRRDLDLRRFAASANTPLPGALKRAAGRLARPLAHVLLRVAGKVRRPD